MERNESVDLCGVSNPELGSFKERADKPGAANLAIGPLFQMIKEHDCIVLTRDLPDARLRAGDVGTVVHIHRGGAAYEVEFMTLT